MDNTTNKILRNCFLKGIAAVGQNLSPLLSPSLRLVHLFLLLLLVVVTMICVVCCVLVLAVVIVMMIVVVGIPRLVPILAEGESCILISVVRIRIRMGSILFWEA